MAIKLNNGTSWVDAHRIHVHTGSGWAKAKQAWVFNGTVWVSTWTNDIVYTTTSNLRGANIFTLMGSPTRAGDYVFINKHSIWGYRGQGFALRTGVFPAGSTLRIVNQGTIRGVGGNGGTYGGAGSPGEAALYVDMTCTLDNSAGVIAGGGGGGGGAYLYYNGLYYAFSPGGGGAGNEAGVLTGAMEQGPYSGMVAAAYPSAGTDTAGGAGAYYYWSGDGTLRATAGSGGGPGLPGGAGVAVLAYSYTSGAGLPGGAAGKSIHTNGLLTVTSYGSLLGPVG